MDSHLRGWWQTWTVVEIMQILTIYFFISMYSISGFLLIIEYSVEILKICSSDQQCQHYLELSCNVDFQRFYSNFLKQKPWGWWEAPSSLCAHRSSPDYGGYSSTIKIILWGCFLFSLLSLQHLIFWLSYEGRQSCFSFSSCLVQLSVGCWWAGIWPTVAVFTVSAQCLVDLSCNLGNRR